MGKRGPKASGVERVIFYRRLHPDVAAVLGKWLDSNEEFLEGADRLLGNGKNKCEVVKIEDNSQIPKLLEDIERLEKEKAALEDKIKKVVRMSESELVQAVLRKYDLLKASMVKGEYDQG